MRSYKYSLSLGIPTMTISTKETSLFQKDKLEHPTQTFTSISQVVFLLHTVPTSTVPSVCQVFSWQNAGPSLCV